jgi:hypothetical protein
MTYRITIFRAVVRATGEIVTLEVNARSKSAAIKKAKIIVQEDDACELKWQYDDELLGEETDSVDVLEFEEIEEAKS